MEIIDVSIKMTTMMHRTVIKGCRKVKELRDRKYSADVYRWFPPPLFIIIISTFQLGIHLFYFSLICESYYPDADDMMWSSMDSTVSPLVPIDSMLIFRLDKKNHLWRYLSYMFLHSSWQHLSLNLFVQLIMGFLLEMVHGSFRTAIVYFSGVLAGFFGMFLSGFKAYLVGPSCGVYALLAGHAANVLLNYENLRSGYGRLKGLTFIVCLDITTSVCYNLFYGESVTKPWMSHPAHELGMYCGFCIGLVVLKNFNENKNYIEWAKWLFGLVAYIAIVLVMSFNMTSWITITS